MSSRSYSVAAISGLALGAGHRPASGTLLTAAHGITIDPRVIFAVIGFGIAAAVFTMIVRLIVRSITENGNDRRYARMVDDYADRHLDLLEWGDAPEAPAASRTAKVPCPRSHTTRTHDARKSASSGVRYHRAPVGRD